MGKVMLPCGMTQTRASFPTKSKASLNASFKALAVRSLKAPTA